MSVTGARLISCVSPSGGCITVGGLNPTTYGAVGDGPEDGPRDEAVATGAGIIPCVRKCLLALERTANLRVQPGNVHGYAREGRMR